MDRNFKEALKHRRSYYSISDRSPVSDAKIQEIIEWALMFVPSTFNSQSTRIVLLLGNENKKFWGMVKDTLKELISSEAYKKTEEKIDNSLASGYGTVLFFEDEAVVKSLQESFPAYSERFPLWAEQASAMHQLAVWVMLEDVGFGASLQHYNNLVNKEVLKTWNLPTGWSLVAEMPFGLPVEEPLEKENRPLEQRIKVFNS